MKNNALQTIQTDIVKIQELLFSENQLNGLSVLERDLILSKLRLVYQNVLDLPVNKEVIHPPKIEPNVIEQAEFLEPATPLQVIEAKNEAIIEKVSENLIEIEPFFEIVAPKEEPKIIEEPIRIKKTVATKKEIIADKFVQTKFLNDVLAMYSQNENLSTKFQKQPLTDIFSGIGVNDKFLFIRELFSNDANLYKTTLDEINKMSTFNEAAQYLDSHFQWDFENKVVQKLFELISRKTNVNLT